MLPSVAYDSKSIIRSDFKESDSDDSCGSGSGSMEHGDAIGCRQGDKLGDAQGDIQGDGGFERLRRCIEIESSGAVKLLFAVGDGAFSR